MCIRDRVLITLCGGSAGAAAVCKCSTSSKPYHIPTCLMVVNMYMQQLLAATTSDIKSLKMRLH